MPAIPKQSGAWLRAQFKAAKPVRAPGVFDGMSARQAARLGCRAVYVSGAATAAARGFPDMGIIGIPEIVEQSRILAEASGLPTIVDGDTGFGGLPSLRRLVWELETAGAAAVHIEDQPNPKKCGFMKTEPSVSIDEMLQRISAARVAASDIVIVARLDCLIHEGIEETVKRVRAYQEGGAEMLFVNGIKTLEELKRVADVATIPLLHNMSGSDLSPDVTDQQAQEFGVKLVIYPIHAARAATKAATRVLTHIAKGEPIPPDEMMPFRDYFELAGWEETETFERAALDGANKRPVLR